MPQVTSYVLFLRSKEWKSWSLHGDVGDLDELRRYLVKNLGAKLANIGESSPELEALKEGQVVYRDFDGGYYDAAYVTKATFSIPEE